MDPLLHYLKYGKKEGRTFPKLYTEEYNKLRFDFDGSQYLKLYPDVAESAMDPLLHYVQNGKNEGRIFTETCSGQYNKIRNLFDGEAYLRANPDVAKAAIDPFDHYIQHGIVEGRKFCNKNEQETEETLEFNNSFQEFLNRTLTNPIVKLPWTDEKKKIRDTMDGITQMLMQKASNTDVLCSIIMPVYNRANTVAESIQSVLNQTYKNFELVIVDDGSQDNSIEVIQSFHDERIVFRKNGVNKGLCYTRNHGLQVSKGKYIFYLDSDNTWDPRFIQTMVGAFLTLPDAQAVYCGQYLYNGNDNKPFAIRYGAFNKSLLENGNYIDINCFGHVREILHDVGDFDRTLRSWEDYHFILRIMYKYNIYSIPVLLSNYYFNKAGNSITSTVDVTPYQAIIRQLIEDEKKKRNESAQKAKLQIGVSAVVVDYCTKEHLHACVNTLIDNGCNEIIICSNDKSSNVQHEILQLQEQGIVKLVEVAQEDSISKKIQKSIAMAGKANDILLVDGNLVYDSGAVTALQNAGYSMHNCWITVPRQVVQPNPSIINQHVPYANGKIECDISLSGHYKNVKHIPIYHNGDIVELNYASFFSMYIKREAIDDSILEITSTDDSNAAAVLCNMVMTVFGKKIYYVANAIVHQNAKNDI